MPCASVIESYNVKFVNLGGHIIKAQFLYQVDLQALLLLGFMIIWVALFERVLFWRPLQSITYVIRYILSFGVLAAAIVLFGSVFEYSRLLFVGLFCVTLVASIFLWRSRGLGIKKLELPTLSLISWGGAFFVIPVLHFISRLHMAFLPHEHGDPLYYHVYAPKYWAHVGRIVFDQQHPSFSQATLIEAIYGLPFALFGSETGSEASMIVCVQIFSQLLHLIFGQGLIVFCLYSHFKKSVANVRLWPFLFGLSYFVVAQPSVDWTASLAKNDAMFLGWSVVASVLLLSKEYFWSGLAVAFAVFSKWLGLPLILLGTLSILFTSPKNQRFFRIESILQFGIGTVLGLFPLLMRNYLNAKNPLFPALDNLLGPHWIAGPWRLSNESILGNPLFTWEHLKSMFAWFVAVVPDRFGGRVLLAIVVCGPIILLYRNILSRNAFLRVVLVYILFLICTVSIIRPAADSRYGAFALIIGSIAVIDRLLSLLPTGCFRKAGAVAALGVFAVLPMPLHQVPKYYSIHARSEPLAYVRQFHLMYSTLESLKKIIPSDNNILMFTEKGLLYFDRFPVVTQESRLVEKLFDGLTWNEFQLRARKENYHWIVVATDAYSYPQLPQFVEQLKLQSDVIVLRNTQHPTYVWKL